MGWYWCEHQRHRGLWRGRTQTHQGDPPARCRQASCQGTRPRAITQAETSRGRRRQVWGVGGGPGLVLCLDSSAVHAQASAAPSGRWGKVGGGESGSRPLSSRVVGAGGAPATLCRACPRPPLGHTDHAPVTPADDAPTSGPSPSQQQHIRAGVTHRGGARAAGEVPLLHESPQPGLTGRPQSREVPRARRPRAHQAQQAGQRACRRPTLVGAGGPTLPVSLLGGRPWRSRHRPAQAQGPTTVHSSWHRGSRQGPPKTASSGAGPGLPNQQSRGSQASRGRGWRAGGCAFALSDQKPTATQITDHSPWATA